MSLSLRGNLHIKTPSLKNTKANKEQSRKQKKKLKIDYNGISAKALYFWSISPGASFRNQKQGRRRMAEDLSPELQHPCDT